MPKLPAESKSKPQKPKARRRRPRPKPAPSPPGPAPSWRIQGPVIFTAWDPGAAQAGPWSIAREIVSGESPVWACGATGTIVQAESGQQAHDSAAYIAPLTGDKAVVATQGGWLPPQPFLGAGVNVCMAECYLPDVANALEGYGQAVRDGWPYVWPVIGLYHDWPFSDYLQLYKGETVPWLSHFGRNFGVWIAEEMSAQNWQDLRAYLAALGG